MYCLIYIIGLFCRRDQQMEAFVFFVFLIKRCNTRDGITRKVSLKMDHGKKEEDASGIFGSEQVATAKKRPNRAGRQKQRCYLPIFHFLILSSAEYFEEDEWMDGQAESAHARRIWAGRGPIFLLSILHLFCPERRSHLSVV